MSDNGENTAYIEEKVLKSDWRSVGGPTPYQKAFDSWISRCEWNCMITLTFNSRSGGITREQAAARFGKLIRSLSARKYGGRSRKKIANASFIELTTKEVPHIHSMMKLCNTAEENKKLIRALWIDVHQSCGDPSEHDREGGKWYIEIVDEKNRDNLRRYLTKECKHNAEGFLEKYAYFDPVGPV